MHLIAANTFIAELELTNRYMDISIYSYNIGCLKSPPEQQNWRIPRGILEKCVLSCKRYFEYLLSTPTTFFCGFTVVQWSSIIHTIVVISRLSFPLSICWDWDGSFAKEHAPLCMYLDSLCYRMQNLSQAKVSDSERNDIDAPMFFKLILDSVKNTFGERLSYAPPPYTASVGDPQPVDVLPNLHCPMLDPDISYLMDPFRCSTTNQTNVAQKSNIFEQNMPLYHDIWATMTADWANQ
jgi:hypothetical protein